MMDRMLALASLAEACRKDVGRTTFFRDRGLTGREVGAFGLGYFGPEALSVIRGMTAEDRRGLSSELAITPMFIGNPVFPIANAAGIIVGLACRSATHRAKYVNSRFPKGENLYGLSVTKGDIWKAGMAFVTEGYMDVIRAWQCGVPCVCGVMGAMMSRHQLELIARYTKRVRLVLDSDRAGTEGAQRSLQMASRWYRDLDVAPLRLPDGVKDWDELCSMTGKARFKVAVQGGGDPWGRLRAARERLASGAR